MTALERRLEADLEAARRERRELLAEFNNRTRNSMAFIRSILRRTAPRCGTVEEFLQHTEGRLGAFGRAQSMITQHPDGTEFGSLLRGELLAHAIHDGDTITITGPELRLQPRASEQFALVFNELVFNSIKFGALRGQLGELNVSWRLSDETPEPFVEFDWRETGQRPIAEPGAPGFGTELIEKSLAYELGATGQLAHQADGTTCTIRVPASSRLLVGAQGIGGTLSEDSEPSR